MLATLLNKVAHPRARSVAGEGLNVAKRLRLSVREEEFSQLLRAPEPQ
jgi:hypothetical protein